MRFFLAPIDVHDNTCSHEYIAHSSLVSLSALEKPHGALAWEIAPSPAPRSALNGWFGTSAKTGTIAFALRLKKNAILLIFRLQSRVLFARNAAPHGTQKPRNAISSTDLEARSGGYLLVDGSLFRPKYGGKRVIGAYAAHHGGTAIADGG
jgi:hypothetical protein